jgi:peptidyl-prolyl cis-trans isomerase C
MVRLQVQEAQRRGIQVPQEIVEQEYEALRADFPSEKVFLDTLQKAKTDPQTWRKGMWEALMMAKLEEMMAGRVEVKPEEIEAYWNANRASIQRDMVHARQVLVRTEHEAKKIAAALERGISFEAQVKEHSVDPLTRTKGGDLGWISRGEAFAEFESGVFSLKPQSVSAPFKGRYGYHIVQILEKKDANQTSLNDYREKISAIIRQSKWQSERTAWLQSLKSGAAIDRPVTSH